MGDLHNLSRRAPGSPGMCLMGMVGAGPTGVGGAGAAPATPINLKGMKVDFELDDTFVDVDTLLGMEDADMLLGSYYSPFRNADDGGVPLPMSAAPTSALEKMVTAVVPALHSAAAAAGLQQQHLQPHTSRTHLSPSAARIAHSPLSAAPGSAVRRSFRLTPQKHVYNHPSRSPYRARGLNVSGLGGAAHAATASPAGGSVGGAGVGAGGAGAGMENSYAFKSPSLELGDTYDAMSLGIDDGSFLSGNQNQNQNQTQNHNHNHNRIHHNHNHNQNHSHHQPITQPTINRNLVVGAEHRAQSTHAHQKQRSSSSGAAKSSSKKKKQSGGGSAGPKMIHPSMVGVAPKRGEYKCGKCGFFPKKTKHNCDEERVRRTVAGLPVGKGPSPGAGGGGGGASIGSSKLPLSAEMMAAKEYQYGAPIKIKFGGPY